MKSWSKPSSRVDFWRRFLLSLPFWRDVARMSSPSAVMWFYGGGVWMRGFNIVRK